MACQIRYNEDHSMFTLILPDGSAFEEEDVPDTGETLFVDPDDGKRYLAVLETYDGDELQIDTVYRLDAIATEVGEADTEDEDEEEAV
jgi:hypothetical protein